ncbi:cytochrome P450 [Actinokineospora baliensis]|uniref:cytochrome P450 n=1 Tax=Actinokineospora baliensis TaxID=547056 RepID=UPI00195BC5CE|nr:cytochrome P450 [Actinokineospora baliensis]MBM7775505.1 cytochrome P450 [Actinokineospora baliensis]
MASGNGATSAPARQGDPDPYPNYAWLRDQAPVSPLVSPNATRPTWFVASFELAKQCLADVRLSNDDRNGGDHEVVDDGDDHIARGLLRLDRPDHTKLRRMVSSMFSPGAAERARSMVESVCHAAIDRFAERGEADVIAEYGLPVPVAVIHEVLGVPDSQRDDPAHCLDLFVRAGLDRPFDQDAYLELIEYVDRLVAYKRANPGDDVTTSLLRNLDAGELTDVRELRSMMLSLLGAGHISTVQFLGSSVLRLLQHPDQLARLTSGAVRWKDAVHEMLRYDPPVQASVYRYALADMEIGGVQVAKGDAVLISLGAANRDLAAFDNADEFHADRPVGLNLAFGYGAHLCLGVHLARLEGEIALDILFRRLRGIRMSTPVEEIAWGYGPMLRGPLELRIAFDA